MSASVPLNRLQVRNKLAQELKLDTLPFKAQLIVISSSLASEHVSAVYDGKGRLSKGTSDTWYYIVAYYEHSCTYEEWGFVSQISLRYLNAGKQEWKVLRNLCLKKSAVTTPIEFDLYQRDDDFNASEEVFICIREDENGLRPSEHVFTRRRTLLLWLLQDSRFQEHYPLTNSALALLNSLNDKDGNWNVMLDRWSYLLLARETLSCSDAVKQRWIEGEIKILQHRLLLRPDLHTQICQVTNTTPISFEAAMQAIPKLHQQNIERISKLDRLDDLPLGWATPIFKEMQRLIDLEAEHVENGRLLTDIMKPRSNPPEKDDTITFHDIMHGTMPCAPKCMKRILETIHGNEVDQALLDVDTRKLAYRYLIENGIEEEHIVAFSRPRNIIAYELEEPSLSWKSENGEETIATAVQNENAKYVIAQNEEKAYQPISCSTMMSKGLCPYRTPSQTAVPPDEWKRAFVFGKKRCHDNLAEIHEARKASGRSIGVAVKSAWTMSPWCYTQTAFKGEGANADLQAKREKEREAKQSQKRKATDTVKEQKKAEKQAKKQKCDEEKAERKKEREAKREAKVAKVNEESARIQEDLFDEVDDTFLEEFSRDRDEEEVEMEFAPLRTQ